jgi:hypothetical protein
MAITVSVVRRNNFANQRRVIADITFDSSYVTAGEPLAPSDLGMTSINEAVPHGLFRTSSGTTAIDTSYDRTNNKLFAYWGNAGSASVIPEVSSTTDLSTFSGRYTFTGN